MISIPLDLVLAPAPHREVKDADRITPALSIFIHQHLSVIVIDGSRG